MREECGCEGRGVREECEVSGCKEGQVSVNEWQVPFHVCVCPLMALTAISQHTPDKTEVSPPFCRSPAGATTPTLAHTPDMEHMQLCVCAHPTPMAAQPSPHTQSPLALLETKRGHFVPLARLVGHQYVALSAATRHTRCWVDT